MYIQSADALTFVKSLDNDSIDLICTDPPFYGIVKDDWDNQWSSPNQFADWLVNIFQAALPKLKPTGSLVFFGGIGKHKEHPLFRIITKLEDAGYFFRNLITWKKKRAYGKSHDYLFCREEIVWMSRSAERTGVTFNIPLLNEKRGYAGYSEKYPAKSEYLRVSNVFTDINELFRPERKCQKPLPLMNRLITTHSNQNDLVVDLFSGWGSTGVAALHAGRKFRGCEKIPSDAHDANQRCVFAAADYTSNTVPTYINNLTNVTPNEMWTSEIFES